MSERAISLPMREMRFSAFAPDTIVETEEGPLPLEWVVAGHRIQTRDEGLVPVLWTAATEPEDLGEDGVAILIPDGALGFGAPTEPLVVGAGHRLLIRHPAAELYFAAPEVFVEARDLVGANGIGPVECGPDFAFLHVCLTMPAVIEICETASATLGLAGSVSPCPVLDDTEALVLRDVIAEPSAGALRRTA